MVAIDLYQLATDPDYCRDPDPYPYRCQHCREYCARSDFPPELIVICLKCLRANPTLWLDAVFREPV